MDERSSETARAAEYAAALAAETQRYEQCDHVHDLSPIFHYWSNTHIHPQLSAFGFGGPDQLFEKYLVEICDRSRQPHRFVSLGSGNCDLEIAIAAKLRASGTASFTIDCFDLNPAMLERGRAAAAVSGVQDNLRFFRSDLNEWSAGAECDAVLANQSLHHIVELEHVLGEVKRSLRPGGLFLVSDMIGRNGHRRWPEALEVVNEFWRMLPPSYRFNRQTGFYEEWYGDRDCSGEGFEGVRAQDILPLLLEHFHFRLFFGFANAVDPFVDRAIGPNFDAAADWDRRFIDELHRRDESEIAAGRLTPTHMLAVLGAEAGGDFRGNLRPEACVRPADRVPLTIAMPQSAYDEAAWPHGTEQEFAAVRARLTELTAIVQRHSQTLDDLRQEVNWGEGLQQELKKRTAWARQMEQQFEERSAWAKRLETELAGQTAWARGLEAQLEERTGWALALNQQFAEAQTDLAERTAWANRLEAELAERTSWALELNRQFAEAQKDLAERTAWGSDLARQLEERTAWAASLRDELRIQRARSDALQAEISGYLRNPLRLVGRIAAGIWRRLRGRQSTL